MYGRGLNDHKTVNIKDFATVFLSRTQGCPGYGNSHGYGYGMGMGTPWVCVDSMGIFE